MTTLTPRGTPLSRFLSDGWVTTKRNLLKIKRVPDILVFTLIQPIMFVLLFTYVYGGVIEIPGSSYAEFLMAGIFAQTVVFGSTYSGSAMAQDLKDGIIDRFRTLPMSPAAVLVGRTNGDMYINAITPEECVRRWRRACTPWLAASTASRCNTTAWSRPNWAGPSTTFSIRRRTPATRTG